MMINIKQPLFILFVTVSLTIISCSSSINETVNVNGIPTSAGTDAPAAVAVNTPTATATDASPSSTALPEVKTQCAGNLQENHKLDLSGIVVLEKIAHQLNSPLGFDLFDPNTKKIIRTDDQGWVIKVSPDKKYLAYTYDTWDSHYIRIMDSDGKTIFDFADFSVYSDGVFEAYFNWQNSKQIRIVTVNINDVYPYLINLFTQERTSIKTDWVDAYRPGDPYQDKVADWKFDRDSTSRYFVYGANILYDPTLTYVLFPKENGEVSLVDVQSEVELAHANFTDWGRLPSWSPDGEYLTIVNREGSVEEFYLISHGGNEFQKITDFAREFDYTSISEYAWSPGGTQIAFWLKLEEDNQEDGPQSELAILDIPTRQVTRLCIQGISSNAYEPWAMNHPEPIWSPDGKYVLITQWDSPDARKNYYVLVVDLLTGDVESISKNVAPIGWMVKEQ